MTESTTSTHVVAAAIAAASSSDVNGDAPDENFSATAALVSYLRLEADLAEEKARRLRQQATILAQKFGISTNAQETYEMDPGQLPPLDENGVPKYKGKKRGRKPKTRKRKSNPNRRKRQHTGYTLYMQEHYPTAKEANPGFPSKDIIAMIAKQWAELAPNEKTQWKSRAALTHTEGDAGSGVDGEVAAAATEVDEVEDDGENDDDDDDEDDNDDDDEEVEPSDVDDDGESAPPARKNRRGKKSDHR